MRFWCSRDEIFGSPSRKRIPDARPYIPRFSMVTASLTALTKKGAKFEWGPEQQYAFDELRKLIMQHLQKFENGEHPVAYFSKKFSAAETRYSTYEQELHALSIAILHWRTYLEGTSFTVRTDHNPLRFLHSQKELTKRQARYINRLLPFQFTSRPRIQQGIPGNPEVRRARVHSEERYTILAE
uniref:Reverse transcriptase RNase H-like domain-containing protein n=1 Tax=Rhodosorus marinus TaxID=101924 RepID=A0A7S2ZXC7_9RHOD|mmetsp:Transcript_34681/g.136723  ORF Transcript_34681/g.136723 Transcript_34681/m.136723 type:complete len:184 (+) Transcript_34681:232-783(+)